MKRIMLCFVTIVASLQALSMEPRLPSYADYLAGISKDAPEFERTFVSKTVPLTQDKIEELKQKAAQYKYIVVLFDTSGSTSFGGGSRFPPITTEKVLETIKQTYENPEIPKDNLVDYLAEELNVGSRFAPGFLDRKFIENAIKALENGTCPTGEEKINEAVEDAPLKTKHISLAQAEGLARIFNILAHTKNDDSELFLLSFSSSVQDPVNISVPHHISSAQAFADIAQNLSNILPQPNFGGTRLSPALSVAFSHINKSPADDTLLIVVTDGQTDDSNKTSLLLAEYSKRLGNCGKRFDIFAVGAGSIATANNYYIETRGFQRYGERHSNFSHVSGNHPTYSGSECNMGYLQGLVNFKTLLGRGAYEGAYLDYSALVNKFMDFLIGKDDTANGLYVQGDNGKWWAPKSHQYLLAEYFLSQEQDQVKYDRDTIKANVYKISDPILSKNIIKVVGEYGPGRYYLCAPKNLLVFNPSDKTLSSTNPEIQKAIKYVEQNPIKNTLSKNHHLYEIWGENSGS